MDLRGLCSKIDLDSIRAKFPHMPAMPAMPPIKLPKSMPKLKSRKIFRTSREDVNKATPKQTPRPTSLSLRPIQQPAEFINHTPTRISTISSLMQQHTSGSIRRGDKGLASDESFERNDINTYRSAHCIEDDYPSASTLHGALYADSPPIRSPVKRSSAAKPNSPQAIDSNTNAVKMSLGEKLQKSYKDFTDFRFKNLLSKKTVVRSDNIEVNYYVQRYNEDLLAEEREQKRRDREIAENYRFKFKETRQSSTRSYSMSPFDSPITQRIKSEQSLQRLSGKAGRTVSEQSGDESGMEITPPRRGGKHLRHPRGYSENSMSDGNELDEVPIQAPISSSLWAIKEKQNKVERSQAPTMVKKGHKERMRRLTSYIPSHEESGAESTNDAGERKKHSKLQKFGRHGHVDEESNNATEKSEDSLDEDKSANKPLDAFKKNLKRFKSTMSIKRQPEGTKETEAEGEQQKIERSATSPTLTRGEKLTTRLRRFKTREVTSIDEDEVSPKKKSEPNNGSPLRSVIANKLQTWKMSFKKRPDETTNTGDELSPEKQRRSNTLKDKLKYIRRRKNSNSHEDREADNEGGGGGGTDTEQKKSSNMEEKFGNVRQRTLKRVNDKMQKIKFFQKSQDNVDGEAASKTASTRAKSKPAASVAYKRRAIPTNDDDSAQSSEMDDSSEEILNTQDESYSYASTKKVHAVWTTKPIMTDSTESEDNDAEYPRVVIHQNESDLFESTLIIAVTTAAAASAVNPATPASPTPKITEIITPPRPKALNWIAKKDSEASAAFSKSLSPNDDNGKSEWSAPMARGHTRKLSMDSNSDSDSWLTETIRSKQISGVASKEETRCTSAVALNSIQENEEPWRVHAMYPEEKIYRAQSIDIFAENVKRSAFEDFDDELKNEPVLKIVLKSNSEDGSFGKDSSEDAADDDNSSRVTKVRVENIREENKPLSPEPVKIAFEEQQSRQIGNSRESLDANFDENEEYTDDEDDYDDDDRPPSTAPSPPPMSPPPPPLPQRQPSVRLTKCIPVSLEEMLLPPLPATRPPAIPNKLPPIIPERTESMSRVAKPLVKTSSLRLAYSEQVKPADVGKVNKLISRFEQPSSDEQQQTKIAVRPRIRERAYSRDESEDYSDYEEKDEEEAEEEENDAEEVKIDYSAKQMEFIDNISRQEISPTLPKALAATQVPSMLDDVEEDIKRTTKKRIAPQPDESMLVKVNPTTVSTTSTALSTSSTTTRMTTVTTSINDADNNTTEQLLGEALERELPKRHLSTGGEHCITIPKLTFTSDMDNNNSQTQSKPSSEYGSPLEYPSSLIGSTETTPTPGRRQQKELRTQYPGSQRRARSLARDDDQYYSFDSDEENSYYSISSTGSSRYIVEI